MASVLLLFSVRNVVFAGDVTEGLALGANAQLRQLAQKGRQADGH